MSYKVTEEGGISIVHLDGEIDMDVTEKAKEIILNIIKTGSADQAHEARILNLQIS